MSLKTFKQLCKLVEGSDLQLEAYKDDLYKHDRAVLEVYDGPFAYAWRKTGTDLVRLWPSVDDIKWFKGTDLNELHAILVEDFLCIDYGVVRPDYSWRNQRFLYFDGKTFTQKTCAELKKIYMTHVDIIIAKERNNVVLAD